MVMLKGGFKFCNLMSVRFEVPYNFSESLIPFYKRYGSSISYLFLPPYPSDSINTRTSIETRKKGCCYIPGSREEYEYHLHKIISAGLRFLVLWQDPNCFITNEILDYYCGLGSAGFIVANDKSARTIKAYNPDLIVVASLVQRLFHDLTKKDFRDYDQIMLYYPFNRALNVLKFLTPFKEKIVLMPNTLCHIECPSIHHWFPKNSIPFKQEKDCLVIKDKERYLLKCGFISPEHLYLFDNYVGGYKLQGREFTTDLLKYTCRLFFERKSPYDFIEVMLGSEFALEYRSAFQRMTPEAYYNVQTPIVLNKI